VLLLGGALTVIQAPLKPKKLKFIKIADSMGTAYSLLTVVY